MNLDGRKFKKFYPDNYSPDEKKHWMGLGIEV